jgi:hypothetical protein
MKPTTRTAVATAAGPNRILILLAAAWMAVAIAMGGVVGAGPTSGGASDTSTAVIGNAQP